MPHVIDDRALNEWSQECIAQYRRQGGLFQCPWNNDTMEYYLVVYHYGAIMNPQLAAYAVVDYAVRNFSTT